MNYRHHFHAGNFADVMKHALLVRLVRALQKKDKGFLYLDTHAGRGGYDLAAAASGDTMERKPEWPDGIGRLAGRDDLPDVLAEYAALARRYDGQQGNSAATPRYYPRSPWFVRELVRPQDRLAIWERQPAECAALRDVLQFSPRTLVHEGDGYGAPRALLPPPERRALVLIDPPFESQHEFADIVRALDEGLRRLPGGVFAVWYPLTERARIDDFFAELRRLRPPPTVALELMIAGPAAAMRMKGCGLLVINPPWKFEQEAEPMLAWLADALAQAPGGGGRVEWVVPE